MRTEKGIEALLSCRFPFSFVRVSKPQSISVDDPATQLKAAHEASAAMSVAVEVLDGAHEVDPCSSLEFRIFFCRKRIL